MNNTKHVTIVLNTKIHQKFKVYCHEKGWIMSRVIENFIMQQLKSEELWTQQPIKKVGDHWKLTGKEKPLKK